MPALPCSRGGFLSWAMAVMAAVTATATATATVVVGVGVTASIVDAGVTQQAAAPAPPSGSTSSQPGLPAGAPSSPQGAGAGAPRRPGGPARDPARAASGDATIGTAIIRGRVLALESGQPLRGTLVRLAGAGPRARAQAKRTDDDGRYEFRDVPAGEFRIVARKGGYAEVWYGQRALREPGRPVKVAEGQTIDRIDFALPRGGVITGRVVDELGEPVEGADVALLQYRVVGAPRQLVRQNSVRTNDLGQYRLFGLLPGDYYVSANVPSYIVGEVDDQDVGYVPTYFPSTPSAAEAQRVTVTIGQESAADIQLVPSRVVRVTGSAVDSSGEPLKGGFVELRAQGFAAMGLGMRGQQIQEDGTFTITGVPPGAYHLFASTRGPGGPNPAAQERGIAAVTVGGEDVTGLRIVTSVGATLRGRVTIEGGSAPAATSAAAPNAATNPGRAGGGRPDGAITLSCAPVDPDIASMGSGRPVRVSESLTFEITNLHAPCVLRASGGSSFGPPTGPAGGLVLKSVTFNGTDVTDQPIDATAAKGRIAGGLAVVMTTRVTTLTGAAQGDGNRPVADYDVVAFSTDKAFWGGVGTRRVGRARADQSGQFRMRGLAPGEYYVVALPFLEPGTEQDPERLAQLAAGAATVTLNEGETQAVTLRLLTP